MTGISEDLIMKKILVIVPTRSRNHKTKEFVEEFFKNSEISDLLFGLDDDDQHTYDRIQNVKYEVNPRLRLNGTLNLLAKKYCEHYECISFMGDDHRTRTKGWDSIIYEKIKDIPFGIAYGNDLLAEERLPTAVIMKSEIIKRLGFMSPHSLTHLYLDNFWLDLGKRLNSIHYFPKVIIEHMHYGRKGKSPKDDIYIEVNSPEMHKKDKLAYKIYLQENFENDLKKFK